MKIAISGCGITGAAAAFFLSKAGHDVTIFEQARKCGPVGAGIMLQPSGQFVMERMGLLDEIASTSQRLDGMTAMRSCGKRLVQLRYNVLGNDLCAYGVHRGRLFQLLFEACQEVGTKVVNGARVIDYQRLDSTNNDSRIRLVTKKDEIGVSHGEFDFLICADGSRSHLREMSPLKSKVLEYDFAALWMTGKSDFQPNELYQLVKGTTNLVGLLPIGMGECSYFWGLPANQYKALRNSDFESWREQAVKLCPESESILNAEDGFERFTFSGYRHVTMKSYVGNRIVFMGDAAHATSPHLGQGVNLGLEDAECFSNCLNEVGDFERASKKYNRLRKRKLRYYQQLTRMLTPFFQSHGRVKGNARNLALPWLPVIPYVRTQMLKTLCGTKKGWLN